MENIIRSLDPGSPLEGRAHAGDRLVSINGHVIRDVLDYKFHAYDCDLKLLLQRPDRVIGQLGRRDIFRVEKLAQEQNILFLFQLFLLLFYHYQVFTQFFNSLFNLAKLITFCDFRYGKSEFLMFIMS